MKHLCVVGLQWGDEGKGKIVDVLSQEVDVIIRYQGGANAGHTVFVGEEKFVLHHLPTGVLRDHTTSILANGMVIEPRALLEEIEALPAGSRRRIYVCERAHLVLPTHRARDRRREEGEHRIGTTVRGIGPAYEDKFARRGVRVGALLAEEFLNSQLPRRLTAELEAGELEAGDLEAGDLEAGDLTTTGEVGEFIEDCRRLRRCLEDRIVDARLLLTELDRAGKRFLFEGAQGSLLDIDFGTYPYVTSSSASFAGLGPGTGFSPRRVDHVLGVTKVYCTRVGDGPFPSELGHDDAEPLREAGGEYGATTGRPRRCGWLDLVALRHSAGLNDVDSIALTKADVLAGRASVPVVTGYRLDGKSLASFPSSPSDLERVEPITEEWPGWSQVNDRGMDAFLARLEAHLRVPVSILSTGRRRRDVKLREPLATFLTPRGRT